MRQAIEQFLYKHAAKAKPIEISRNYASWDVNTRPTPGAQAKLEKLTAEFDLLYANPKEFQQISLWYKEFLQIVEEDPLLGRQVQLLHHGYLMNQVPEETIRRLAKIQTEAEATFSKFRPIVKGKPLSDNEIRKILRESDDVEERKKAWVASKEIGSEVAPMVKEMVVLRNQNARSLGFKNYYEMALKCQELDPASLGRNLKDLADKTEEPYFRWKTKLDQTLMKRFKCKPEELRPWHYADPFFAQVPPSKDANLDSYFADKNIEQLTKRTYDQLGLEIEKILLQSDLHAREGKCQHAFCLDLNHEGDIRVLCNIEPNEHWMMVMLHEFGHAVYDQYLSRDLPYLLQRPAHILTTESMAMLMGRQTHCYDWLTEVAGLPPADIKKDLPKILQEQAAGMILFMRWALVMVDFESTMYADPEQDLNKIWWNLVKKYQGLTPPEERDFPDWAAKIHLTVAPVYYQNYILGELMASQVRQFIKDEIPSGKLINNPYAGEFLKQHLFAPGARWDWNTLLMNSTGHPLDVNPFLNDFLPQLKI
ncbi:MAG TPA: M2 family metallopeptidase [Bdellovibrionota bacterium]|nr:M2 family metallopeptidase [Bdellovibrionota bacterium]